MAGLDEQPADRGGGLRCSLFGLRAADRKGLSDFRMHRSGTMGTALVLLHKEKTKQTALREACFAVGSGRNGGGGISREDRRYGGK